MKQLIIVLLFSICFLVSIKAHSQNNSWSSWQPVYQEQLGDQMVSVLISYKLQSCKSGYTTYYRVKNEFSRTGASLDFRLVFNSCSGEESHEDQLVDLSKPREFGHSGNWLLTEHTPQIVNVRLNGQGLQGTKSQTLASQDLRRKLMNTVDEWVSNCANAVAQLHGFPGWPPEPGSVMKSYADDIENSLLQARQLKKDLINSTEKNLTELNEELAEVERDKAATEQTINQGWSNYQNEYKGIQDTRKHDAEQRVQQQADENARLLAAQQQREEEERQRLQAERERREEEERQRQAQLAANILLYNDRVNSNNAYTQAKLEEQRRNSTLSDVPKYNSSSAKGTIAGTSTRSLGSQAFGGNGKGYLDVVDDTTLNIAKKSTAKDDDDSDSTSIKATLPIAPDTFPECDVTFDVVEAQRLPPVVSVTVVGTSCDADMGRRILDFRNQDAPHAQFYIGQYCTALQENAREKLLISWHQLQDKRGRMLEQELTDCLYLLTKGYLLQFNSAMAGANLCLTKLRNNQVYYQHNRTVVENLQYKINNSRQQMQMWISPTNPDPNNALNVLRTMSNLGIGICNLSNSVKTK